MKNVKPGDRVLVSCITACGTCRFCREGRYGQCLGGGGWILGHNIDGTQAEYVRVPFADTSTYPVPAGVTDEEILMLADILPTAYEVGVLNGGVRPATSSPSSAPGRSGSRRSSGAQLYSPSHIVAIDLADARLDAAKQFGADVTVNNGREDPLAIVRELTGGLGADVAIEAVGMPATFELAAELVRPGGHVANIGVHGEPATLPPRDALDAGRDDHDGPRRHLLDADAQPADGDPPARRGPLRDPSLPLDQFMEAYDVFSNASETGALKVVLTRASLNDSPRDWPAS